ncbi:hypothetical protein C4D60_Mb07t04190 [Musa balbisiana]|uniref:NAC domain-containing protein n=1 Tax=Musa balbisiana TaxID=52838 RepID=A0A4S8JE14_MUSBA|nr:hypothetical protein C4D60_Mb07t04190 [Musa balbisiana]
MDLLRFLIGQWEAEECQSWLRVKLLSEFDSNHQITSDSWTRYGFLIGQWEEVEYVGSSSQEIVMAKTNLPPGFRFHPTDVELVWYYLKRKVMGKPFRSEAISEVELYKFAPWELPEKSRLRTRDLEWYFFCHRDKKYSNGSRSNRATDGGYWKATGRDKSVIHNSCTVGMRRTLVFHEGKPPKGERTNWVMYEYRLESRELVDAGFAQDAYLLCKVFQKSGLGPRIGEQYGAPFNEEDWEDDTAIESSFPLPCVSSCLSAEPLDSQAIHADPVSKQPIASSAVEVLSDHDLLDADGISLEDLAEFLNSSPLVENANGKMPDLTIPSMNVNEAAAMDPEGIGDFGEFVPPLNDPLSEYLSSLARTLSS